MDSLGTPPRSPRALRILAVANWDFDAVRVTWAVQRLAALRARGLEVEVLSEDCIGDKRGYLRLWRRLRRRLSESRFDLVAPLYGSFLGLLCALQRRVPCVISFAGSDLNGKTNLDKTTLASLGVPASQLTAALAAGVSVRNQAMREAILWPPARRRAVVIGSGVDTSHFRPLPRDAACRERGVPVEDTRVLFVATGAADRPYKRLPLARAAVDRVPGAVLEIVESVPFSRMPLVYASADALVLTSINEGSPNCVKEALACGLPVVSVDVGDAREVLAGLTNCAVVDATPSALGEALDRALLDRRRCPEGPERMARDHSLERMVSRFVGFYEEVAARCPAEPPAGVSSLSWLLRTRRLLAALTAAGAVCGALLASAMPAWYEAKAQLAVLPVSDPTSTGGINAADNASAALTTLTAVLQSASLADALAGRFDLARVYGVPSVEKARAALRRHVSIRPDHKTKMLTIAIEDQSPRRARELTAEMAALGKARAAELWTAGSREQRLKLEARLREVGAALQKAEDALRRFREENRVIDLAEQTRQTVSQVASFERARIEKEVGVEYARGFGAEGSSEVMRSERESAAAASAVSQVGRGRREALLPLGDLPRLEAEHARLRREIDVNAARYETISRQIEQLRAFELMPGGHAELVDAPAEPQRRARPLHGLLALEGALCGLLGGALLSVGRRRRGPEEAGG